ncbi:AsmA family protein [Ancylobacter sp. SL191]|uniref:AsmA family protein n=1 Tax=Ancylobacter sp. SL191 TaxID=2995166 RepID=UPI0022703A67|nr:AsmA family protein [Ancylobacter sp. SL191]WAC27359.1 AsmA family protein [Ancylobacter sp. SL191]
MKRLVPILLLPVALVLFGAALAPKLASEERLRTEVAALLEHAAGQPPRIDGPVRFSIFPWPALEVSEIRFGEGSATLTVPRARVVLDLLPLLTGQARADHIELDQPELALAGGVDIDPFSTGVLRLASAKFNADLTVTNGRLVLTHGGTREVVVPAADLRIGWRGGRDAAIEGRVVWRGEPIHVDLAASSLGVLLTGGASPIRVKLSGPPFDMAFDGTGKLAGGPVANGTLTVASRQLRQTLAWLGLEAPTAQGFGSFSLQAQSILSGQGATLSGARLELDGNVSEGGFNLRLDGARPVIQGSLAADRLDLSPYGELSISDAAGDNWSGETIDLSRLSQLDVDLRLSATEVRAGAGRLERMAASATLKSGRLLLAIGEAEAWNGIFRAALHVSPAPVGAEARLDLSADDVALAGAMGDLFRMGRLEGTGSFRFTAGGTGASVAAIVGGLNGSFSLSGTDGSLVGFDVGRILARLEQRPLSATGDLRGGRTPYSQIELESTIRNGIATLSRLDVASDKLRISLAGESSIADRDLDFVGVAQLVSAAKAGDAPPQGAASAYVAGAAPGAPQNVSFELPFIVRGNWNQPVVLPDPQALIRRSGAARPLFSKPAAYGSVAPAP